MDFNLQWEGKSLSALPVPWRSERWLTASRLKTTVAPLGFLHIKMFRIPLYVHDEYVHDDYGHDDCVHDDYVHDDFVHDLPY